MVTEPDPEGTVDPSDIEIDGEDGYNRDPGARPDEAGIPEVADDMSPGTGEVAEPERATMPTEAPVESTAHGTTAQEQAEGPSLDERLAAEEPELDSPERRPVETPGPMHVEEKPPEQ